MLPIVGIAVIVIDKDFIYPARRCDLVGRESEAVVVVEGFMAVSLGWEARLIHLHVKICRVFDEFIELCGL